MKPTVLFLLLLSACSDLLDARNYRTYKVTWTCVSPEGCERADQVVLIDRAQIINGNEIVFFSSTRDDKFEDVTQMVPSDDLPAGCFWLHDVSFFGLELEPARFCRTSGALELELSILDRDTPTYSKWLAEGREIDP
jgi:hypothetical protein